MTKDDVKHKSLAYRISHIWIYRNSVLFYCICLLSVRFLTVGIHTPKATDAVDKKGDTLDVVRTKVLIGELGDCFKKWYTNIKIEESQLGSVSAPRFFTFSTLYHNRLLLDRFLVEFGTSPHLPKNREKVRRLLNYGARAA